MRSIHRIFIALLLASCAPAAPPALAPVAAREKDERGENGQAERECVTPQGRAIAGTYDLDGDGVADVVTQQRDRLSFYVRRGACVERVGNVVLEGPLASVSVLPAASGAEVSVDTWLVHGDRRRVHYVFQNGRLEARGRAEEIPGPRPPTTSANSAAR